MTLVVKDGNGALQNFASYTDANSEQQQKVAFDPGAGHTLHQVAIDSLVSGDNTLVAAPGAGLRIYVTSYTIVANQAVNVRWKSGANSISGLMDFLANDGASPAGNKEAPVLVLNVNEALVLNASAAASLGGHLVYFTAA